MRKLKGIDRLGILTVLLLTLITITGLLSFDTTRSYSITNQFGSEVRLFGSGIYARDSFFRAPIFIGSDFTMLFLVAPAMVLALFQEVKKRTIKTKLILTAISSVVFYYAMSIAFGVSYNQYHLFYIALFSCSLFLMISLMLGIDTRALQNTLSWNLPSKGVRTFLVFSGIALFIAWLPDIIPTLISGTSLPLIEVYTTEITYVLDMGIISPVMFICLRLLRKKSGLGTVILAILLTLCVIMGVMLPVQTAFQMMAGIEIPIPVFVTKVGIFVLLAAFAAYFEIKLFKSIRG